MYRMNINKNYVIIAQLILMLTLILTEKDTISTFSLYEDKMLTTTEVSLIEFRRYDRNTIREIYRQKTGSAGRKNVLAFSEKVRDTCVIHAEYTEDWNNHRLLAVIGHEVMHCLGAHHE